MKQKFKKQKFKKKLSLSKKKLFIIDDREAKQIKGGTILSWWTPACEPSDRVLCAPQSDPCVNETWICDDPGESTAIVCV